MNKLNTKYSNIEFQHKRFRLLNGEIIFKDALIKIYSYIYCLRKFQNDQVISMISYAKYKNQYMGSGKFYIFLEDSTNFQILLKASIGMEKKILDFSPRFQNLP